MCAGGRQGEDHEERVREEEMRLGTAHAQRVENERDWGEGGGWGT